MTGLVFVAFRLCPDDGMAARCMLCSGSGGTGSNGEKKASSLSIDRSGLFRLEPHSHDTPQGKEPETPMVKHLRALIQVLQAVSTCYLLMADMPYHFGIILL